MFGVIPILDSHKNTPFYVSLYDYIKQEIQKGTIKHFLFSAWHRCSYYPN